MIDLLLVHGIVVTMDPHRRVLENSGIAIDQGKIIAVGSSSELERSYQALKVINCNHKIIMPGLIDAHGHGGHSLLKGIASDTPSIWSKVVTQVYQHFTTDEYWYTDGKLSALERLKSGITCGLSVIGSEPRSDDPIFANNHARAYAELGIREVVAVGPCNPPWPHSFSRWVDGKRITRDVTFEQAMEGASEAIETWNHGANDRIRVFITPFLIIPSLDSTGPTPPDIASVLTEQDCKQSRAIRDISSKYKTRIHSDAFGGMVKLASKDEYGLLGPDVSLQHCNGLSTEEVLILANTDTRVGYTPGSSHGKAPTPVPQLIEAGVTVAIVSDGTAPKTPFDLFQAARKAQLVQQLVMKDSFYLPAGKLLEMITIDAARVLGWDDKIGSLEVGKKADVILVDMNKAHMTPEIMPIHRLAYEAVGEDVCTVIVDGNILMDDRKTITVSEDDILQEAQQETLRTIERADLYRHMNLPPTFWGHARMTLDEARWL